MDFTDTPAEAAFRDEVRTWLADHLVGEFAEIGGGGGPADESDWELRVEWERVLGRDRWIGLGWPKEYGERLFAPTLIAYGTEEQKQRFLPKIQSAEELWCQGYSEPNAGSDLSNVQTRAVLDGDQWVINGQKVWTTLAHRSDWCFAVVRTDTEAPAHKGISYLLVPMKQDGVTARPLEQMTGTAEFNEVFFDDARTDKQNFVGEVNDGWKVAMATLGFERGTAFLSQQLAFQRELSDLVDVAHKNGATADETIRQRLADEYVGVQIMKYNGMRMLTSLVKKGVLGPEACIGKVYWSSWHRKLGELAMDVLGANALVVEGEPGGNYELGDLHRIFMASRAETIYAGSSEIQRNIIG